MRTSVFSPSLERTRTVAVAVLTAPFKRRTWAELAYFVTGSVLVSAAAVALATLGVAGVLLSFVAVGVLVLAGGLRVARGLAGWQRGLAEVMLDERVAPPDAFHHRPGFVGWLRAALADPAVVYFVARIPLTIFGAWFGVSIWLQALESLWSPLGSGGSEIHFGIWGRLSSAHNLGGPTPPVDRLGLFVTGIVLLLIAPWATKLVVGIDRALMHALIGPDAAASRVQRLEESRNRTVDAATERLRRIERDLHDGTQAQLVALAMRLGQAKEKLDRFDGTDVDLDPVRQLVDQAHRGAKEAISDLRDLVRGIHPPALDTGLDNALSTLVARSPVPTLAEVSIPVRPGPAIETIAYFCAAELLANVAQHADATRASLTCTQHGPWLRIVVRDDGHGGARICRTGSTSSGLAGLADRVTTVDGHLSVTSPGGGPTTIIVDLPCRG